MENIDFKFEKSHDLCLPLSTDNKGFIVIKRLTDLLIGIPFLIISTPVIILIAILIRIDSPGNPFFLQAREGRNRELFTIYKFRTLFIEHFGNITSEEVPNAYRITRIGKYLRRYKLDELPQLLNVVLGDMSLTGPRPYVSFYIPGQEVYTEPQHQRLLVKPGLTGITQISGNVMLSWPNRIWLDIWYIRHWSLLLDLKIIFFTLSAVAKGETYKSDPFNLYSQLPEEPAL